jgi:peptidoglycan/xylan/chitin deacetylase (PgdA/CDA1 family)
MFSGIGSIFMLHRTAPYEDGNIVYNENMKISPEELVRFIQELKRKKRVFLSLDEVVNIVRSGKKPAHKFVAFTLDDGYKDNLTYGYPIFKEYNIPFCIYVTNSFPDQTTNLWWYALENLILNNETLNVDGRNLDNSTLHKKQKNFLALREEVLNKQFRDPYTFFKQLGRITFDVSKERSKMCLTWPEIINLSQDPLATIGCHTVNHLPLAKLEHPEVGFEIRHSKEELERQLNRKVRHFAFPFGSRNEAANREYEVSQSIGFDSIVTTLHGNIHLSDNLQRLERIFLSPFRDSSLFRRNVFWSIKSLVSSIKKSS